MSEERREKPGKDTMIRDRIKKAESDEGQASLWAREALTQRAESAEEASRLWFRLALSLVAVLAMLVGGVVAVGAGVEIPGVGSFSVSKQGGPSGAAPLPVMSEEVAP